MIVAEGLTKVYAGRFQAVKGVSFTVRAGEVFGVLGPNGAGKSTTIAMLTTLLRPTAGRAWVAGCDAAARPLEVRRRIGYVSQDVAVDDMLTGQENLLLQARLYHLPARELRARLDRALDMVDLTARPGDLVSAYSGGMRKRLDIAAGLLHAPRVLFLDEPTLGLDVQTRQRIWEYIRRLRDEAGMTVFLTTHYMEEVDSLCDRLAVIDHGEIVAMGTPAELKGKVRGDVVTLTLDAEAAGDDELLRRLGGLPPVQAVRPGAGGVLSLLTEHGEGALPAVLALCQERGVPVRGLALQRPTLDDVFLHYTGRQLRETGEGASARRLSGALRRARR